MAFIDDLSSFTCDCGHRSLFFIGTVSEMERQSRRRKQILGDSEPDEHEIEFDSGKAVAMICPKLGRLKLGSRW